MRGRGVIAAIGLAATSGSCAEPPCLTTPGDVCLVVGTGELGFNGDGLPPAATDLFLVSAARRGPDGLLWFMDFNNQRLRRIDAEGRVETVIGGGFHAIADVSAPLLETPLENPIDFAFLADGRPVFVSYHDPRVMTIGADGTLEILAGAEDAEPGTIGDEGDGGPASAARFIQLDGIAVAPDDTIYVSDSKANRVRKIQGGVITTVAGTGEKVWTGDGGPGAAAGLWWPTGLELAPDGALFIADTFNHAVRRLAPDGTITTVAGRGVAGDEGDGGPATMATLKQPFGVALDEDGSLYVADRGNFKVRRVDPDGVITTVAGRGTEGASGDEGPARAATFGYLARVALDDDGLLIADQSNATVRRLVLR